MVYLTNRSGRHISVDKICRHISFSQPNNNKSYGGTTFVLYVSVNFENFAAMGIGLKGDIIGLNVVSSTFSQKSLYFGDLGAQNIFYMLKISIQCSFENMTTLITNLWFNVDFIDNNNNIPFFWRGSVQDSK